MNVVLVDDDPITRTLVSKILEPEGHFVIRLDNGKSACEFLDLNPHIDILVTDIQMPGMSGIELINTVRAQPRKQYLPILAISGVIAVHEVTELLEIGADRFLPKPIHRAKFLTEFRYLVEDLKMRRSKQDSETSEVA